MKKSPVMAVMILLLTFSYSNGEADEAIRVAAIFSKTGKAALSNAMALNGIRFAIEELNQQGGVLGRNIKLIEFDNKSSALGSKIAAQKAVEAAVIVVFGASWSSHSLAMAPVFQKAGIPMISPVSTNPALTLVGDYIFRICYTDPFQGRILAKFAIQHLKAKTAGVLINANRKYSEGLAEYFVQSYSQLGGRVLFEENYLEKTADFTPIINKIKALQPEVLFHPGHTKVSAYFLKQARINGIKTTFIGGDAWNDSMYKIVGSIIEGSYYSTHWHEDGTGVKNRLFVEKYRRKSRKYDPGSPLGEDCVYLFADAVRRAKSLEPSRIRDAIAATNNFQGVTGNIRFDDNGDPIKSAVILKFENGTSVYVKTIEP